MKRWIPFGIGLFLMTHVTDAFASAASSGSIGMVNTPLGIAALLIFVVAYLAVMGEEFIHLRKSKPVILAAGLIWLINAILVSGSDPAQSEQLEIVLEHNLLEYASLMLFLLVAMTYINAMTERNVFEALRAWLVSRNFSYQQLFWITGFLAFFLSPIADNLTTALLMGAVCLSVGAGSPKFVALACVNVVVAANAGGAFSPFGDITTLMVWQSGKASFFEFLVLFIPSVVNFLVPAAIMSFAVPKDLPASVEDRVELKRGALIICGLFLCTIATAVAFEQFLHLPPYLGMMTGLSYLFFYGYYMNLTTRTSSQAFEQFNIFNEVAQAEWDTLFFFFGVIFCVGGLGFIGYLEIVSSYLYLDMGPSFANITLGLISAVVDNIPVMFAVLTMDPEMDLFQWLLITLATGTGGSLLSIGSAAGVALMGQARGVYTFFSHLKWIWAIALGYAASIYAHFLVNAA